MKNSRNLGRIIRYDFKAGGSQLRGRYLTAAVILVFIGGIVLEEQKTQLLSGNFWDLTSQLFQGIAEYKKEERASQFQLPVLLILHQLFLFFTVGNYPKEDMCGYGKQVFIESSSRQRWWIGKVMWVLGHILFYYMATWILLIIAAVYVTGEGIYPSDSELFLMGGNISEIIKNLLLLPMGASMAIAIWQLVIGIFIKPVWGYAAAVTCLVVSAYKVTPVLPGNQMMMLRNACLAGGKIKFAEGAGFCAGFILCGIICGMVMIKRCDIIDKGE